MIDGLLSLIFFILEITIITFLWKYARSNPHLPIISVMLLLLATYQVSEFLICIGINPVITGRVGFIIITFLPPTGLLFTTKLLDISRPELPLYFLAGLSFSIYYAIIPDSVQLIDCNPLYAIYHYDNGPLYGIYYYFIILLSVYLLTYHFWVDQVKDRDLILLLLGYLVFLLPMGITVFLDPTTSSAIPSIMCKYAFSLAIILGIMGIQGRNPSAEV